jgi:DNA-binding transcriptional LysR family regulator
MRKATLPSSDVLTPEALRLLRKIAECGSFAGAARASGLVPSTLTYRVGQIEQALDVLLFDRRSHLARPTEACRELLREGERLIADIDAVATRVRRLAMGWERSLTIAVDAIIDRSAIIEMCRAFFLLDPPTRLRLRYESLNGTLDAVTSEQADLAIGVVADASTVSDLGVRQMGSSTFVFVVAPGHPLARAPEPLGDDVIKRYRAIAVADSSRAASRLTIRLLSGQDVFTVPDMATMCDSLLGGLGVGYLPAELAQPHLDAGRLVIRRVERAGGETQVSYVWPKRSVALQGKALQWWLAELARPVRQSALLNRIPGYGRETDWPFADTAIRPSRRS